MKRLLLLLVGCVALTGCHSTTKSSKAGVDSSYQAGSLVPTSAEKPVVADPMPAETAGREALPTKLDAETAMSPVYGVTSTACQNHDSEGAEGDEFVRKCPGYANYRLWSSGFGDLVNYRIEAEGLPEGQTLMIPLFPLETGDASEYVRADLFVEKLDDQIEWRLGANGKPYALLVRATFYRNKGSVKASVRPANQAAAFMLVRGLLGCEELQIDLPATNTAYNPTEQARMLAARYLIAHHR